MAYPYGTQGAPAVGVGAPGLPQRSNPIGADPAGPPLQRIIVRAGDLYATTPFLTPDWATFGRVTALGRGGFGRGGTSGLSISGTNGAPSGGGAACSGTNIETISPGTPIAITFDTTATLVSFLGYQMSAGNGGDATLTAGGAAGVASGGAINFSGGAGWNPASSTLGAGGGGAAGRGGPGVTATSANGAASGLGDAYTTGGGAGGAAQDSGGIRFGGPSRTDVSQLGATLLGGSTGLFGNGVVASNCNGGDGGGGAGGAIGSASNIPGAALVLIELW